MFLYVIADFGAVQLLRYDTLTRAIYANYLLDPAGGRRAEPRARRPGDRRGGRPAAGRRAGTARTRAAAGAPLTVALGRWRVAALAFVGGLLGLALAAPVAVLVYWTVRGVERGHARGRTRSSPTPARLIEPALNTLGGQRQRGAGRRRGRAAGRLPHARHRGRVGGGAAALVIGGFALPGLVIALALAFWTLRSPGLIGALYQTLPLLVGAYALHFGALALGPAQVAAVERAPAAGRRRPHPGPGAPRPAARRSTCR